MKTRYKSEKDTNANHEKTVKYVESSFTAMSEMFGSVTEGV